MPKWTPEKHETLVRMAEKGKTWAEIGALIGHTANACQMHYSRYVTDKVTKPRKCAPDLTPEQIEQARRLRATGKRGSLELRIVAKKMGVREIQLLRVFAPHQVEARKNRDIVRTPSRDAGRTIPIRPPQCVLDERERSYQPMSISRELLGDPRPGRSALDKMRAA